MDFRSQWYIRKSLKTRNLSLISYTYIWAQLRHVIKYLLSISSARTDEVYRLTVSTENVIYNTEETELYWKSSVLESTKRAYNSLLDESDPTWTPAIRIFNTSWKDARRISFKNLNFLLRFQVPAVTLVGRTLSLVYV